jgi:hypothetical protein
MAETQEHYVLDSNTVAIIPVPDGGTATVTAFGDTVYYGSSPTVTEDDSDGEILTTESETFPMTTYLRVAQGTSAEIFVSTTYEVDELVQ